MPALPPAITAFRALFEQFTPGVDDWLRADVELRPPTYGKTWSGKDLVRRLLVYAAQEFQGLSYTDSWSDGSSHILRFEGEIGGQRFSGVDIVHLDREGRIACIEIFARPPAAMLTLRDRMGAHVQADPVVARLMGHAQ